MNEGGYISTTRMVSTGLWGLVIVLMATAWITLIVGYEHRQIAYMLALQACVTSATAAVAHLRMYHMKLASLVRVTAGLSAPSGPNEGPSLRRVH